MDSLKKYTQKRNFAQTPEPEPFPLQPKGLPPQADGRFVVQEHHARRLHWDFRLEMDGVLKSWALPKGLPRDKSERRLAIEVEDHPLTYIDFEGKIPAGNYGAGEVIIQDKGFYALLERNPQKFKFALQGEHLQGAYLLIKRGQEENHWLMLKYQ
jgi:bifunctional non-homologous end joining protein LigD